MSDIVLETLDGSLQHCYVLVTFNLSLSLDLNYIYWRYSILFMSYQLGALHTAGGME